MSKASSLALGQASGQVFCQLCGQKVVGRGKVFHHPQWSRELSLLVCRDCARQKPRCRECGLPMAAASTSGVCTTCSESLRFCLACSSPVGSRYLEFDGVGPYCETCYQQRPPCDVCGAPLTNEQWQLSDGRRICAHCHTTAIYNPADAAQIYEQMQIDTAQLLGLTLNVPTGLALVDRNQLAEVIRKQTESNTVQPGVVPSTGFRAGAPGEAGAQAAAIPQAEVFLDPVRTLGIYARRGIRRGIYVQTGLPRMLFLQVAAHEYAHAWQGENCPALREVLVHEGFAEWCAYNVIGKYGYTRGQDRMQRRHDIYGRGLRWALDIEAEHGKAAVIQACRRAV